MCYLRISIISIQTNRFGIVCKIRQTGTYMYTHGRFCSLNPALLRPPPPNRHRPAQLGRDPQLEATGSKCLCPRLKDMFSQCTWMCLSPRRKGWLQSVMAGLCPDGVCAYKATAPQNILKSEPVQCTCITWSMKVCMLHYPFEPRVPLSHVPTTGIWAPCWGQWVKHLTGVHAPEWKKLYHFEVKAQSTFWKNIHLVPY